MSVALFPHQKALLQKCIALENGDVCLKDNNNESINTRIGIIGDKVGSGKSYVMLELACHDLPEKDLYRHVLHDLITIKINREPSMYGPTVIVVHHSLMHQWKRYVESYCPSRRCCFLTRKSDMETLCEIKDYDIVFLSSSMYNRFCIIYNNTFFRRVFIDEADTIQLNSAMVIHSLFYWFVTSAYHNLIKPYGDGFGHWGIKHSGFIKDLFVYLQGICEYEYSSYIIVKNDDAQVDESCPTLPCLKDCVIKCRHFTTGYSKDKIITKCMEANTASSLESLTQRIESSDCPICFDKLKDKAVLLCCSNVYCSSCLGKWLKYVHVCPTCRSPKRIEDVHIISSGLDHVSAIGESNTKLMNFLNLLNDAENARKIIVYSADESMFNNIIPYLVLSNVTYSYLKGTASRYECILNQFRTSKERSVLLLDDTFYACGLNLQEATDIVFFYKFDNEIEKKIIGSAQRLGRTTELRVWYFITT